MWSRLGVELHTHDERVRTAEAARAAAEQKVRTLDDYARGLAALRAGGDAAMGGTSIIEAPRELARELFAEERRILGEAAVVGATLAKTYVAKALDGRRFDALLRLFE